MQTFDQALLNLFTRRQDLDGRGAQGRHPPARLQAAGRLRGSALDLGRPDLLRGRGRKPTAPGPDGGTARPAAAVRASDRAGQRVRLSAARVPASAGALTSLCKALVSSDGGAGCRARRDKPGFRLHELQRDVSRMPTAEIISGKWTLLVIRDLADGRSRFCELERSLEGISPRTLSLRLRALEAEGIVERRTYPEVPPRVEYRLTAKGDALVPLIEQMRSYGREWLLDAREQAAPGGLTASPSSDANGGASDGEPALVRARSAETRGAVKEPHVRPGSFGPLLAPASASMIVALVALFVAMGGTTYAVKRASEAQRRAGPAQAECGAHQAHQGAQRHALEDRQERDRLVAGRDGTRSTAATSSSRASARCRTRPRLQPPTDAAKVGGRSVSEVHVRRTGRHRRDEGPRAGRPDAERGLRRGPARSPSAATTGVSGALIHAGGMAPAPPGTRPTTASTSPTRSTAPGRRDRHGHLGRPHLCPPGRRGGDRDLPRTGDWPAAASSPARRPDSSHIRPGDSGALRRPADRRLGEGPAPCAAN